MAGAKPFSCPVCGEAVPASAKACPHCGACEKSGWKEDGETDGLDLPEDDSDYEKFTAEEFGEPKKSPRKDRFFHVAGVVILVIVLIAFAANMLVRW